MEVSTAHVVVIPFAAQGHINPMVQFSKRLASKSLKVTLLILHPHRLPENSAGDSVTVVTVCDDVKQGKDTPTIQDYQTNFKNIMSPTLSEIINNDRHPVNCVVYDSHLPWVVDMVKEAGIIAAPFFTQSCAVGYIYCSVYEGKLGTNFVDENLCIELPGLPALSRCDLPSFVGDSKNYPDGLGVLTGQFSNLDKADWIFFNTFNALENETVNWMASKWGIKPIGPTIPSMLMDKRLKDDTDYGLNLFKPNSETCIQWLDSKQPRSVIYVSFGSLAGLGEHQMAELATGLRATNRNFLWVVREREATKLPENFIEETQGIGLVVNWSPQLRVLAHESVGCFVTHCGWNSTLEALSMGVPMVAMAIWTDQPMNGKFVADVWGVGVRVERGGDGIVGKGEIERCVREVMEGEKGEEIRRNCEKWKRMAKMAVDEGGSSDRNIDEFVQKLEGKYSVMVNGCVD